MTHYLQILRDSNGNNYLGIILPIEEIQPFLNQLRDILGDNYETYTKLQQIRDNGKYHLTFLTVSEFNQKSKELGYDKFSQFLGNVQKSNIDDLKLLGLGTSEKSGNIAYYIVCKSELLDGGRNNFNLDPKDFHITLGFKDRDVHGVRKNLLMTQPGDFLKRLKFEYNREGQSFDFIKGLTNFDLEFFKLIEPIQINETNAIFRCGDNDYLQVSLVDNRLMITGKWQDFNRLPILSDTLIERKFKKIN